MVGIVWKQSDVNEVRTDAALRDIEDQRQQAERDQRERDAMLVKPEAPAQPAGSPAWDFSGMRAALTPWDASSQTDAPQPPAQQQTATTGTGNPWDFSGLLETLTPWQPKPAAAPQSAGQQQPGAPGMARPGATPSAAGGQTQLGEIVEGDPQGFFQSARAYADMVEREYGIPAAFTLAVAANETGYGQKRYMAGANNYFGIQDTTGTGTPYVDWRPGPNGERVYYEARQAGFASPLEGFRGFGRFLTENPRYGQAIARYRQTGDAAQFARDVHAAGYAEDPEWSNKVTSIMGGVPTSTGVGSVTAPAGVSSQGGDLTPDQAALDDPDKWSLCGPVAAVAMARAKGGNWTVAEAKRMAEQNGWWNPRQGMGGLADQAKLLNSMGYAATAGAADWQKIAQDVSSGNPVTLSTRWIPDGHYVVLERYDPQTGRYYVGGAGSTLKVTTGRSKWMTVDEINNLGTVEGALYFDNPSSPTPSVAVAAQRETGLNAGGAAPATPPQPAAGVTSAPAAGLPPSVAQKWRQQFGRDPSPEEVQELRGVMA